MPGGFGPRLAIEAGFLALVAVGCAVADLRRALIVAAVGVAWLIVVLIEVAVWRAQLERPSVIDPEAGLRRLSVELVRDDRAVAGSTSVRVLGPGDAPPAPASPAVSALAEPLDFPSGIYPLRADAGRVTPEESGQYTADRATATSAGVDDPGPAAGAEEPVAAREEPPPAGAEAEQEEGAAVPNDAPAGGDVEPGRRSEGAQ